MNCEDAKSLQYLIPPLLNVMTAAKGGATLAAIAFVYYGLWGTALNSVTDDPFASIFREQEDKNENDKVF